MYQLYCFIKAYHINNCFAHVIIFATCVKFFCQMSIINKFLKIYALKCTLLIPRYLMVEYFIVLLKHS